MTDFLAGPVQCKLWAAVGHSANPTAILMLIADQQPKFNLILQLEMRTCSRLRLTLTQCEVQIPLDLIESHRNSDRKICSTPQMLYFPSPLHHHLPADAKHKHNHQTQVDA